MSIVETLQRPADANGFARIQRRPATLCRHETESKERNVATQATTSVAAVRREGEQVLEAQASAVLRESSYDALRRASCEVRNGVLTLRGQVPSFYVKQIAQTVVRHVLESGMVIDNQLEVDRM